MELAVAALHALCAPMLGRLGHLPGPQRDAQWLVQTLGFVARRLLAERAGLVLAFREPADDHGLEGLPECVIEGLAADDARHLLDAMIPGSLKLGRGGNQAAAAGGFGLPAEMPLYQPR